MNSAVGGDVVPALVSEKPLRTNLAIRLGRWGESSSARVKVQDDEECRASVLVATLGCDAVALAWLGGAVARSGVLRKARLPSVFRELLP